MGVERDGAFAFAFADADMTCVPTGAVDLTCFDDDDSGCVIGPWTLTLIDPVDH